MAFTRATVIDATPTGDTVKEAVLDLDTDLTNIFTHLNTHEGKVSTHGVTGDLVGDSDAQTLSNKTLTSPVLNTSVSGTAVLDEDNMVSDSDTKIATQQSIKAYADLHILHSLAGVANDFLVASGANTFVKKTLAETGAILETDLDHGNIQGLGGDDHTQYLLADGTRFCTGNFTVSGGGYLRVISEADGDVEVQLYADAAANNTDNWRILVSDGDSFEIQTFATGAFATALGLTSAGVVATGAVKDEDNMVSDSATHLATQQSIKAYADLMLPLTGGTLSGNLVLQNGLYMSQGKAIWSTTATLGSCNTVFMSGDTLYLSHVNVTTIVQGATVTLNAASGISGTCIKDEDNMVSDSPTHLATQQSIKAYTDTLEGLVLKKDGSVALTADWDAGAHTIKCDQLWGTDGNGLRLLDDAGNLGISILDGGKVGIGILTPGTRLHVYHATENVVARLQSGDPGAYISFKDDTTVTLPYCGAIGDDFVINVNAAQQIRIEGDGSGFDVANSALILDEDTMASDSATKLATQQSVKAYVDTLDGFNLKKNGTVELTANWDAGAFTIYCARIKGRAGAPGIGMYRNADGHGVWVDETNGHTRVTNYLWVGSHAEQAAPSNGFAVFHGDFVYQMSAANAAALIDSSLSLGNLGTKDHDLLDGLGDDDHTQYLLEDGTRGLSGDWDAGAHTIKCDVLQATDANELSLLSNAGTFGIFVAGYVGIGRGSAGFPLDVYHATNDIPLRLESGDAGCKIQLGDGTYTMELGIVGDYFVIKPDAVDNAFKVHNTAPADSLEIDASGDIVVGQRVGIGIAPGSQLSVYHATDDELAWFTSADATALIGIQDDAYAATLGLVGAYFSIRPDSVDDALRIHNTAPDSAFTIGDNGKVTIKYNDATEMLVLWDWNASSAANATPWLSFKYGAGGDGLGLIGYANTTSDEIWISNTGKGILFLSSGSECGRWWGDLPQKHFMVNDVLWTDGTIGIVIDQDGYDDTIMAFQANEVAHGATDLVETDTFAAFQKWIAAAGGLEVQGLTNTVVGLALVGTYTTDHTTKGVGEDAAIVIQARKISGTGYGVMGANANILAIKNNTSTRWIVDQAGYVWQAGSLRSYGQSIRLLNATSPYIEAQDTTNAVRTVIQSGETIGYVGTYSDHNLTIRRNSIDVLSFTAATGDVSGLSIKDENDMASDSAVHLATQQSIKAYADLMLPLAGGALTGILTTNSNIDITGPADLTISGNGRLGIGDTTPNYPLHVYHLTEDDLFCLESADANCWMYMKDLTVTVKMGIDAANERFELHTDGGGPVLLIHAGAAAYCVYGISDDDGHLWVNRKSGTGIAMNLTGFGASADANLIHINFGWNDNVSEQGTHGYIGWCNGANDDLYLTNLTGGIRFLTANTERLFLDETGGITGTAIKDEDNMASNSATHLASQQSIKAYADLMLPLAGGNMTGNILLEDTKYISCRDSGSTARTILGTQGSDNLYIGNDVLATVLRGSGISGGTIKDEDNMASNSATHLVTQQSVKAYVDTLEGLVLKKDGSVALTADWDAGAHSIKCDQIMGTDATGLKILDDGGNYGVFIVDGGYVGIGRGSAGFPLDVYHATNDVLLRLESGDVGCRVQLGDGTYTMEMGIQGEYFVIKPDGVDTAFKVNATAPADSFIINASGGVGGVAIKDEDNQASDSDLHLATQQSIKAYVDALETAVNAKLPQYRTSFQVWNSATDSNVVGASSATIDMDAEGWDTGGDFLADVFTAPEAGMYLFTAGVRLDQLDMDADYYILYLMTSNKNYTQIIDPAGFDEDLPYWSFSMTILADMDASDTAYCYIQAVNGADITDIVGDAIQWTYFHGVQLTNVDPV